MSGNRLKWLLPLLLLGSAACSKPKPAASIDPGSATPPPPPPISGLPVTVTLKQRSAAPIPGAKEKLSIRVEDITGGQTMVSLLSGGSARLLQPRSMKAGDAARFHYEGQDFELKLGKLENALIGEDFATFTVSGGDPAGGAAAASPVKGDELTESRKIERLIGSIESLKDAKFRRNGKDYEAKEAAAHLRRKLDAAGGKITTAEQFIEHLATKSSVSGEAYEIRFADGRTVKTADFLKAELKKLEGKPQEKNAE